MRRPYVRVFVAFVGFVPVLIAQRTFQLELYDLLVFVVVVVVFFAHVLLEFAACGSLFCLAAAPPHRATPLRSMSAA